MKQQAGIRTALSNVAAINGSNCLSELPLNGKINLRGDAQNPGFRQAIEDATGLKIPIEANTTTSNDTLKIFWLGPDEWLIHLPLSDVSRCMDAIKKAADTLHIAMTEVSDYFSIIQLSGKQVREVLASGAPLDIRPEHFAPGQCAQTYFGHASILLWPVDEQTYCLQVRWSYAQYIYRYLTQSIANVQQLADFQA